MIVRAGTVLTGREVLRPGWVETAGSVIVALGSGEPTRPADVDLTDTATVVPGFVDTHVHGGGGASFSGGPAQVAEAARLHRRHGTTTLLASLVTEAPADLLRQVAELADQVRDGVIDGIHLEGPWLAQSRCGAHDPALLRDPDPTELDRVLGDGRGTIRMVTLAPERAGAPAAIGRVVDAGAVAAVGHTDATYDQTRAAIDAGATVATHLFNAMRPVHHREPGPVIALLEDRRVTVEMIADGVHIDPALYRHVTRSAGPDRVSLVTDAMAAAGMADGPYRIGPLAVEVTGGVAHLAGTDTIAGSTATMDRLFRFAVRHCGLPREAALHAAVLQSSVNPARALGLPDPVLAPGNRADLVFLDDALTVTGVIHRGAPVSAA
ncbi:MAG TPA: N-acetylglucosamine-6-phosphate deacetylase [Mycobacterium sp.]|nr:N-acetylglucosamine-6-phosphate deacetylase [Mycobacterium sp.]HQE14346.1 N-acetylglucosamine-6-phosphate deacetylase [Mycobacterium sp.]